MAAVVSRRAAFHEMLGGRGVEGATPMSRLAGLQHAGLNSPLDRISSRLNYRAAVPEGKTLMSAAALAFALAQVPFIFTCAPRRTQRERAANHDLSRLA